MFIIKAILCLLNLHRWEDHPTRREHGETHYQVCRWCFKAEDERKRIRDDLHAVNN
jgi:hypothetical protein